MADILDLAFRIVASEEVRPAVRPVAKVVYTTKGTVKKTLMKHLVNIAPPYTLLSVKGTGTLRELVLRSSDTSYVLTVDVDGVRALGNTYSWFYDNSPFLKMIDAFLDEEKNQYVLRLSDISFTKSLKVVVDPETYAVSTKIDEVFYVLDLLSQNSG